MRNMIKNVFGWLESRKDLFNKIMPYFLMVYFFLISCPYIFAPWPFLNNIFSNSNTALVLRALFLLLYALFALILLIANKMHLDMKWLLVCVILFILFVLSAILVPKQLGGYSFYFTGKVQYKSTTIGVMSILTHIARFGGDLLCFYFLFTVYARLFQNKNQFTWIIFPCILIALFGCCYAVVFQRDIIRGIISDGLSPEHLTANFHSKNEFGIFLFGGSIAIIYIFFTNTHWGFKFLALLLPVFIAFAFLSNCKLAAICILLLIIFGYIYYIVVCWKTKLKISITLISIALILIVGLILICNVDALKNIPVVGKFFEAISNIFKNFKFNSLFGRASEWGIVPLFVNGIYTFIGFCPAVGYEYIMLTTSINGAATIPVYDLHNAYLDFYAYHGIVGLVALVIVYVYLFSLIAKIGKHNKLSAFLIGGITVCGMLFGMAETYTMFISMSANTFVLNILIVGTIFLEAKNYKIFESKEKKQEVLANA